MGGYVFLVIMAVVIGVVVAVSQSKTESEKVKTEQNTVVKTKFFDSSHTSSSRAKTGSSLGRAAIGGALLGPIGAIAGAGTAKRKTTERHTTTFLVYYSDGTRKHETVENDSSLYNLYMSKLED